VSASSHALECELTRKTDGEIVIVVVWRQGLRGTKNARLPTTTFHTSPFQDGPLAERVRSAARSIASVAVSPQLPNDLLTEASSARLCDLDLRSTQPSR